MTAPQHEQKEADALDQFLENSKQSGTFPTDQTFKEQHFAQELLLTAARTHPDPAFLQELERRLARKAAQTANTQQPSPPAPPFWAAWLAAIKEGFTMKKVTIALGSLAALAILVGAFYFWNQSLRDNTAGSPVADTGEQSGDTPDAGLPTAAPDVDDAGEDEETAVAELPDENLPLLPRLEGSGGGPGLGAGGGGAPADGVAAPTEGMLVEEGMAADSMIMPMIDIFSDTTFILNTTLPLEPTVSMVQQQQGGGDIDLAAAQAIAQRFGFTSPLYTEVLPDFGDEMAIEGGEPYVPPTVYHAFDGNRRLFIDGWGAYYNDSSIEYDYRNPLSYEQALPVAEAFANELGLLDFPYEARAGYGADVFFHRLVNGYPTNQPELVITVNSDGSIPFASLNGLAGVENLGRYPLITAEEAFNLLQSGITENNIPYMFMPGMEVDAIVYEDPYADLYQYWSRMYEPGQEIHLYEWPIVFQPAAGEGAPRIEMHGYILQGEIALLNEIAANNGSQVHVWGQMGPEGKTIQVAGWEPFQNNEPVSEEGTISRAGDEVRFTGTFSGQTYVLPNAPADIPDGLEVYVFGWNVRETGGEFPALDWNSVEKIIDYDAIAIEEGLSSEMPLEEPFHAFTGYAEVTIDSVELEYYYTYIWPENDAEMGRPSFRNPDILLQPTWKLTGTTDNGDRVAFNVQAVDQAYLDGE